MDDVEGYIVIFYQLIGVIFDYKIFRDNNYKITQEFIKRVDLDLFFYYWIGVNECYYCGSLKLFNEFFKLGIERLDRVIVLRRVDLGVFVVGWVIFLQCGILIVRV